MITIDNYTSLSYEEIGNLIDRYFENSYGSSGYYDKNEYFSFEIRKKVYKCSVNFGKTRMKFTIAEIKY